MACPLLRAAITSSASLTQFTAEHGEVATQDRPFLDALRPGRRVAIDDVDALLDRLEHLPQQRVT